jgi:hypothetical protein
MDLMLTIRAVQTPFEGSRNVTVYVPRDTAWKWNDPSVMPTMVNEPWVENRKSARSPQMFTTPRSAPVVTNCSWTTSGGLAAYVEAGANAQPATDATVMTVTPT